MQVKTVTGSKPGREDFRKCLKVKALLCGRYKPSYLDKPNLVEKFTFERNGAQRKIGCVRPCVCVCERERGRVRVHACISVGRYESGRR